MSANPVPRGCAHAHTCDEATRLRVLEASPLTRDLTAQQREELDTYLSAWSWNPDDPLVTAGEEMDGCYIIAAGRVRLTHDTAEGEEITLDIVGPSGIVGPVSVTPSVAENSAWAIDTTCGLFLSSKVLATVVEKFPVLALSIMTLQQRGLDRSHRRDVARTQLPVADRVRTVLMELARKFGKREADGSVLITVRLRRQDIAGMAGTTLESTSRIMATLKENGDIDAGRQWVRIKKPLL